MRSALAKSVVLALIIALSLGGCGSRSANWPLARPRNLPEPPEGKVLFVLYRPHRNEGIGTLMPEADWDVWDGLEKLAAMVNASPFYHVRDPGRFTFWTEYPGKVIFGRPDRSQVSAVAKAGEIYFVRMVLRLAVPQPYRTPLLVPEYEVALEQVAQSYAEQELRKCRVLPGSFGLPAPMP